MWTGRQTLGSIENAIIQLHGEENQLDHALRSAVSDTERLRTQRSQSLRELARIKPDPSWLTAFYLAKPMDREALSRMLLLGFFQLVALASSTTKILFLPVLVAYLALAPLALTLYALEPKDERPRRRLLASLFARGHIQF